MPDPFLPSVLLRGGAEAAEAFFARNYRHETYTDLEAALRAAVRRYLPLEAGGLVYQRNFWVRRDNTAQDLVIVQDIAEDDSYRLAELPVPRLVMVDVGAHIGVFSRAFLKRHPDSRIIAVECCPENIAALEQNVGDFAEIVQAAMTYEPDVALLNAVYADCVSTGGSTVITRQEMQERLDAARAAGDARPDRLGQYWADLRPLATVTLEELMERHGIEFIDVLKLDCEGSELSILEHTTSLDRIGVVVGEYHGREPFLELVERRFAGWKFEILRDGDPGTFWLVSC